MKTIKFITLGIVLLFGIQSNAQVSVNVNIGRPPVWGPTITTEEYYFLPEVNSYYDIRASQFIYLNNGSWIRARQLPTRYRGYNLNTGNIIVLHDYHGHSPYTYYKSHKMKYNNGNHYGNGNGNGNRKDNDNGNRKDNENYRENGNGNGNGNGKHNGKKGKH